MAASDQVPILPGPPHKNLDRWCREGSEELRKMEFTLSGNALKTFARSVTCHSRVGNDLAIQASPSQICLSIDYLQARPFDVFTVSGAQVQCSVLSKAVCSVLRTPITNIDYLSLQLPDIYASKVQWALRCFNGIKKTYWIICNVEPDIQQLSLDRRRYPSIFVVRPCDLNRLPANFQSYLQEITVIATERNSDPSDAASDFGGKAVEFRSYIDHTKGHHAGPSANGISGQADTGEASGYQPQRNRTSASEIPSNHTKIWSQLSGSASRSGSGSDGRQVQEERILKAGGKSGIESISNIQISKAASAEGNIQTGPDSSSLNLSLDGHGFSHCYPSNWVDADKDDTGDNEDGDERCVWGTPPYYEDQ